MSEAQLQLEADWDEFCAWEAKIGGAEGIGVRARWEFGQRLFEKYEKGGGRGGSVLADAIRELSKELGAGKTELYNRRLFFELNQTEEEVSNALESFGSWHEIVKHLNKRGQGEPKPLPDSDYHCITIDPPWPIEKIVREVRPAQGGAIDYSTLSLEEIETLVGQVVTRQNGCHVYLWTTHRFMRDAFNLFDAWDVKYECVMTWVKNVGPTPFSWMYDTEHVLFGRRGSLALEQQGLRLAFNADAVGHSVKPDAFYERVALASPGPRLAMFERGLREGFEVWGDEAPAA